MHDEGAQERKDVGREQVEVAVVLLRVSYMSRSSRRSNLQSESRRDGVGLASGRELSVLHDRTDVEAERRNVGLDVGDFERSREGVVEIND